PHVGRTYGTAQTNRDLEKLRESRGLSREKPAKAELLAPSINIAVQVKQPQVVGLLAPHRPGTLPGVLRVPTVPGQQLLRLPVIPTRLRPRSTRTLPRRFRG